MKNEGYKFLFFILLYGFIDLVMKSSVYIDLLYLGLVLLYLIKKTRAHFKPNTFIKFYICIIMFFGFLSILENGFFIVIGALRFYLLPLLLYFIGYSYNINLQKVNKFLLVIIIASIPLGIITYYLWHGTLILNSLGTGGYADGFGAFYGKGTGHLGLLISIILIYYLYLKITENITTLLFLIVAGLSILIFIASEFKASLYVFSAGIISISIIKYDRRRILKPELILVSFLIIFTISILYNSVFLSGRNSGILDFMTSEKVVEYSNTGGVYETSINLGRVPTILYSVSAIDINEFTSLFGFGLGSGLSSSLSIFKHSANAPYIPIHNIGFAQIVYEIGILGTVLYIFFYLWLIILLLMNMKYSKGQKELFDLNVFLYIYTVVMLVSIFYNNAVFIINFSGVFWFLYGNFQKQISLKNNSQYR